MPQHKCCVITCLKTRKNNAILHLFPNPDKELQRFNEWAKVIKGDVLCLDPKKVYMDYRVCHDHFETIHHTRSSRLSANAFPTLKLSDEVKVVDVEETAATLSNDEFKELADQEEHTNIEIFGFEEEQKELSTAFLKTSLNTITEIMDKFIENDPNFERSSKAKWGVMDALSIYQQLLTERKKKRK